MCLTRELKPHTYFEMMFKDKPFIEERWERPAK
jgi:hypothetical protein